MVHVSIKVNNFKQNFFKKFLKNIFFFKNNKVIVIRALISFNKTNKSSKMINKTIIFQEQNNLSHSVYRYTEINSNDYLNRFYTTTDCYFDPCTPLMNTSRESFDINVSCSSIKTSSSFSF